MRDPTGPGFGSITALISKMQSSPASMSYFIGQNVPVGDDNFTDFYKFLTRKIFEVASVLRTNRLRNPRRFVPATPSLLSAFKGFRKYAL